MSRRRIGKFFRGLFYALLLVVVAATALLWWQGQRTPAGRPDYVALGSSYAAGAGLGPLQAGSPLACARSTNGYPQQLARTKRLGLIDMSCGGATAQHVLNGGQYFQGPQIRTITENTRLVTITVGGNDVGYVGDLSLLAARHTDTAFGRLTDLFWTGPAPAGDRPWDELRETLTNTVRAIRKRAPDAKVVLVSYPRVLPQSGTCDTIGLSSAEADKMRQIADWLASETRKVASREGTLLVDMNALGQGHDACSADPWTSGWRNGGIAPFHPTLAGAQATADEVARVIGRT